MKHLPCLHIWLIAAAKTGTLHNGQESIIRTWYSSKDIEKLTKYNSLLKQIEDGADDLKDDLDTLKSSMSNTAQAAVKAANGGVVALDKLNKGFNWAALGAKALNAAVNFGIAALLSLAVSVISDHIGGGGSPPLTRGTVLVSQRGGGNFRITPACAGNSSSLSSRPCGRWDHPRLRGEQPNCNCKSGNI